MRDNFFQFNVSQGEFAGCFEDNRLGLALPGRRRHRGVSWDDRDLRSGQFFHRIERQWGMSGYGWNARNVEGIQERQMILFRHPVESLNDKLAISAKHAQQ